MRKICYVSGSRADFGLMTSTLIKASSHKDLDISICVTGMHTLGNNETISSLSMQDVVKSGIKICACVESPTLSLRSGIGMALAISDQIRGMVSLFDRESFDAVMILGDRGEMLAAAIAAAHLNIPVIHIHGGERSGTIDEPVRHAISKIAHYHFVATKNSKKRLVRMGERADFIYVTGAPGIDDIINISYESRKNFFNKWGLDLTQKTALCIYHPIIQDGDKLYHQMYQVLDSLAEMGLQAIILTPNTDSGAFYIIEAIQLFRNRRNFYFFDHLERRVYLHFMKYCDFMLGNSSSGIIEAASLGTPVIDIGTRQHLRETSQNVQRVSCKKDEILKTMLKVLSKSPKKVRNVYGDGHAGEKIVDLLIKIPLEVEIIKKINTF